MLYRNERTIGVYQQEVLANLQALASRMRLVETAVENSDADMRIKNQKEVDDLHWRLNAIETRLEELVNSDESVWDVLRLEIDTSINQLGRDIENVIKLVQA